MIRDKAGNTIASANRSAFRTLSTQPVQFTDRIGGGDFSDFLQIRLKKHSSLDVALRGISTELELQNKRGKVLQQATNGSLQVALKRGVYYLHVSRDPRLRIAATSYTLEAAAYPDVAGNSLDDAREISVSNTQSRYKDYVGRSDRTDYYAFGLEDAGSLALGLTSPKGPTKLDVLDADGRVIERIVTKVRRTAARGYGGADIFNLDEGRYYLRVTPKGRDTSSPYDLTTKLLDPADPAATNIKFAITNQASQFEGTVKITGVVKNIGQSLFDSNPGQQTVLLYEIPLGGTPVVVAQRDFEDLAPGQKLKLSYSRNWNSSSPAEGEFPPTYRVAIIYDPDITLDGNPFNDDVNVSNNQLNRSGSGINNLFR